MAIGKRKDSSPRYRTQVSYAQLIAIDAAMLDCSQLVAEVCKQGKIELLYDGRWTEHHFVASLDHVIASRVMDSMAELLSAEWHRVETRWVLASSDREAVSLHRAREFSREVKDPKLKLARSYERRLKALATSLTLVQWRALEAGEKLSGRDLAPSQWGTLRGALSDVAESEKGGAFALHPSALQGNVVISFEKRHPGWTVLRVEWPFVDGGQDGRSYGMLNLEPSAAQGWSPIDWDRTFDLIEVGKAQAGDAEALTPERIAALQTSPYPDDYHKDERFEHQVTVEATDTGEAVIKLLGQDVKASVMMEGEWLKRPFGIVLRKEPAWKLMDSLATASQRKWKPVGPVWVLAPEKKKSEKPLASKRAAKPR